MGRSRTDIDEIEQLELEILRRAHTLAVVGFSSNPTRAGYYVPAYMQRAGYEPKQYERLKSRGLKYDFYLAHGLREHEYDSDWRIFYPKGF